MVNLTVRYATRRRTCLVLTDLYEEIELFEDTEEDSGRYRAWYDGEKLKITYNLSYLTAGIPDLVDTITHEWLHALFDWATVDDPDHRAFNIHDCSGDSDHFIMKVINFD